MKTIFVDESGNLGIGGRFFVIALFAPQNGKRITNFMRHFCAKRHLQEAKAYCLDSAEKQEIFNRLNFANDYTVSYIVADKQNIDNKQILKDKNLCYNYLFNFLIKKTIRSANEDVQVLLDNRSMKVTSINSLQDYIKIKAHYEWGFKYNLTIQYTDSKLSKNIQAADIVANAIYAKYESDKNQFYNQIIISESLKFPFEKFGKNTSPTPKGLSGVVDNSD